jgi:Ser/Thr protein kinase RdoA (MazF antagonist)
MLADAPSLTPDLAAKIAREDFGIVGNASPLPSERDQNFLVEAHAKRIVLKIANASEPRDLLAAQQAAMTHAASWGALVPRVVAATSGEQLVEVSANGRRHFVWAVTWIDGVTMATSNWRSADLLEDFGGKIGALRRALNDFDHPAIHRDFYWDLANATRIVDDDRGLIVDAVVGGAIDTAMRQFHQHTTPLLARLRRGAVHGDLNDHNVLVASHTDPEQRHQRIAGFVDFGDMVHSYAVGDLAIALAYVMLDTDEPLAAARQMVRGHHAVSALDPAEFGALFGLAVVRLCASACFAARQRRENPANEYLDVSQAAIRRTLPVLAVTSFAVAEAMLRDACDLAPSVNVAEVTSCLEAHT